MNLTDNQNDETIMLPDDPSSEILDSRVQAVIREQLENMGGTCGPLARGLNAGQRKLVNIYISMMYPDHPFLLIPAPKHGAN